MKPAAPSREFLAAQVRWAMGRGLPPQVAEDVVHEAWEKASRSFDPRRGTFEAFMQRLVRNDCAGWWRRHGVAERAHAHLRILPRDDDQMARERAALHQAALLEALEPEEREVFAAWALQKHLGKGRVTSADLSRSLGLAPSEYENAKRRLATRLSRLMDQLGLTVTELIFGGERVDRTG